MTEQIKNPNNNNIEVDFRSLIFRYLSIWPWYIIFGILFTTLSWVLIFYSTPKYSIEGYVLAQDDKKNSKFASQDLLKELDLFSGSQLVENEIEVIKSRTILKRTIEDLDLNYQYYKSTDFRTREMYSNCPIKLNLDTIQKVLVGAEIGVEIADAQNFEIACTPKMEGMPGFELKGQFSKPLTTPYGIVTIDKTAMFDKIFVNGAENKEYKNISVKVTTIDQAVNHYRKALKVELTSKMSTVLRLQIEDNIPERGVKFIDHLMDTYLKNDVTIKNEIGEMTLKFLNDRIKLLSNDVNSIETIFEDFRIKNGIVELGQNTHLLLNNVVEYDKQLMQLESQLKLVEDIESYTKNRAESGILAPAVVGLTDPVLLELCQEIIKLESQKALINSSLKKDNPMIVNLNNQINGLRTTLAESVRNVKSAILMGKRQVEKKLRGFDSEIKSIPQKEHQLFDIKRQMEIKQNLYLYLLQKQEEAALSLASTASDNRILDYSVSTEAPIKPVKPIYYGISLLLALLVPIGIKEFMDSYDNTVKTRNDIVSETNFPLLGIIPFSPDPDPLVVNRSAKSAISEAFRNIRSNLKYLAKGADRLVVGVTSNISGEGKTFFSLNFAASIAITNKKVVMIELDLRKPKLAKNINISSNIGVSNYLIDQVTIDQIIMPSGVIDTLDIIPSGPIPPNPAELLISENMERMVKELQERYDYIIIDAPPVGLVSDGFTISEHCHQMFYLLRYDYTAKDYIKFIRDLETSKKLSNVNLILNGVKMSSLGGYGYSQGYSYGYGYYNQESKKRFSLKDFLKFN